MDYPREKQKPRPGHRRIKTDLSSPELPTSKSPLQGLSRITGSSFCRYNSQADECQSKPSSSTSTPKSPHRSPFAYNKWYIRPSVRMKKSLARQGALDGGVQFAYNRLYDMQCVQGSLPFVAVTNDRLQLLEKIPPYNLKLLENFKKNQEMQKKRVPKIIELFLNKKPAFELH